MKNSLLLKCYIGFSVFYLLILLTGQETVAAFMKPFLIPILFFAVYYFENFSTKRALLLALFFSWIGDVILIFADNGELYFIFGLLAFLLSHLVYIVLFIKQPKGNTNSKTTAFWLGITTILLYFVMMLNTLFPKLGSLKIPVVVYAMVITSMLYFAFKGSLNWLKPANNYILLGAIIFVSSDSILAFNKFYEPIPQASFFVMITYTIAQYLITFGILKLNKTNSTTIN